MLFFYRSSSMSSVKVFVMCRLQRIGLSSQRNRILYGLLCSSRVSHTAMNCVVLSLVTIGSLQVTSTPSPSTSMKKAVQFTPCIVTSPASISPILTMLYKAATLYLAIRLRPNRVENVGRSNGFTSLGMVNATAGRVNHMYAADPNDITRDITANTVSGLSDSHLYMFTGFPFLLLGFLFAFLVYR